MDSLVFSMIFPGAVVKYLPYFYYALKNSGKSGMLRLSGSKWTAVIPASSVPAILPFAFTGRPKRSVLNTSSIDYSGVENGGSGGAVRPSRQKQPM
ncbi:MAG: hypothetical protein LBG43_06590 [Treponema sp.]|jgi:hypothetical protein|nr:hypothetical protein [Treponema sp.]